VTIMRNIFFFLLLHVTLFAFDYNLKPQKVHENVWCFFGALEGPNKTNGGNMVNTCYIDTKDGYVIFDSGPTYAYAKQAYAAMQSIKDQKVHSVIASHEHDDHWLGNNFYKEQFNAQLIGPAYIDEHYKDGDETRMFRVLSEDALQGTRIVKQDQQVLKSIKLQIGGETLEIVPLHYKAHTAEDLFVYMPEHKILFSGDLVMNGRITSNRHGSLYGQIEAINTINEKDWEILIPGHGYIIDEHAVDEAKQYFSLLKERLEQAIDEEIDSLDIDANELMHEFKDKAMFSVLNQRNVEDAYTEIEFAE
jgi:cyclase